MERQQTILERLTALGLDAPKCLNGGLHSEAIAELFRSEGPCHLWITDVFGAVQRVVAPGECFAFWRTELRHRVIEEPGFAREQWPGGYAYLVSRWTSPDGTPLLEVQRCA